MSISIEQLLLRLEHLRGLTVTKDTLPLVEARIAEINYLINLCQLMENQ